MSLFDAILSLFNPEVDAEFDTLWKNYFKGLASWCQEARIDLSRNLSYREINAPQLAQEQLLVGEK